MHLRSSLIKRADTVIRNGDTFGQQLRSSSAITHRFLKAWPGVFVLRCLPHPLQQVQRFPGFLPILLCPSLFFLFSQVLALRLQQGGTGMCWERRVGFLSLPLCWS